MDQACYLGVAHGIEVPASLIILVSARRLWWGGGAGLTLPEGPRLLLLLPVRSTDPVTFEGGALYTNSTLGVVVLKGTWRGMGRQYGYLCKQQMTDFYNLAAEDTGRDYAQMADNAGSYYQNLPSYLQDLVQGMAETSGFTLERQKIIASLPDQIFFSGACSTLTVWGSYTGGGPLVIGRNMDWGQHFPRYMPYVVAVIFNPEGGPTSIVNVGFVGWIHFLTGMNSHGLLIYLNAGWLSDSQKHHRKKPLRFV